MTRVTSLTSFADIAALTRKPGNSTTAGKFSAFLRQCLRKLEYGVEYELDEEERRRIRNVSRMYSVTRLTEEMARRAGQLHARAAKELGGKPGADAIDAMVAAVAETAGEKVITENVTDFQHPVVGVEPF